MDNNDLFNQNYQNTGNSGQGVNDLLTRDYSQPAQQNTSPLGSGQYSSNFGQDAFALRESMQSQIPIPPTPPQPVQPQYSGMQQNQYTQPDTSGQNPYTQPPFSDPGYSQVPPMQPYNYSEESDVSVGEWVLSTILMMLPCVGLILLFTWAFGSNTAKAKQNWAKAMLIMMLIGFILGIIFAVTAGVAMVNYFTRYMRYF